jgi:alkaline phosphatase D
VWDDHDYGINNGDRTSPVKAEAQRLYLDFLDEDQSSPRRTQEGLYTSYLLGPKDKQVKLILLDVRYFRDPWSKEGDTLGEKQWKWLENELKSPANVTFIASGIQVIPQDRFGVTERFHPKSAQRLIQLVSKTPNTFLFSGDIHISEVMKSTCTGYPIYEVTSSGLTHTAYTQYGFLGIVYNYLVQTSTYTTAHKVHQRSYCLVEIDWKTAILSFSFMDAAGNSFHTERIGLNDRKAEEPDKLCAYTDLERAIRHWAGSVVLIFPAVLCASAVLIYLRKHSHSY